MVQISEQFYSQKQDNMLKDLIIQNRSFRRFHENHSIDENILRELVDLARLSASARNAQPLKYIFCANLKMNGLIFPTLAWAAYLKDWTGPVEGERPAAYIIMLGDTSIATNFFCDHGIAAQSILLGATERGLGGCIISNIKRDELRSILQIPEKYEIIQIIALGEPLEKVVIEPLSESGDIKYWRDKSDVHHVPKRSLDELILKI
jgi:nitroreductase